MNITSALSTAAHGPIATSEWRDKKISDIPRTDVIVQRELLLAAAREIRETRLELAQITANALHTIGQIAVDTQSPAGPCAPIMPCDGNHAAPACRDRDCWQGHEQTFFDIQSLADLRALISIAVWIRSEQVANAGKIIEIHDGSLRTELQTQDLDLQNALAEMRAGQEWHKRLTALLPIPAPQPSYRKEQTPMKFYKFEAEGDQIFIKATDRTHADRIQETKFGIPKNLLKITEVKEKDLPEGESWIEE